MFWDVFILRGEKMDYKDTLNLPKTDFEMRGNLPKKEPDFQKRWQQLNLNQAILDSNDRSKAFIYMMVLLMQMETCMLVML